ncbi:unnamed protein product (macronuclear) [Paramecium tetraurelia]|uniref:Kelch motif family protein n=1 Tax=Paramecium tetraurelia TaxID=5888 RepID=A0DFB9_PARTE|nr:uncharacterized protein GSPATT00016549001 [Paramecium tetraurelia]CAK81736.1 unnamed protein product [Paramecium tetraurelia]|eukprot:XP_001449133.1 hypothetical protein (macronuclear) [Paramecium tetraurelia strain d4-2]
MKSNYHFTLILIQISLFHRRSKEQKDDQKQLLIEQLNLILTPHKCPKIAQVDKDLEQLNAQINNLKIYDSATYQKSIQKIKSIKKVISQVIDKYFINLISQYQVITTDLLQTSLQPLKQLIYSLRNELHNYDENQVQEVLDRQNIINEEFNLLKNYLPKDITLQINNKSLYDIKDSLQKMVLYLFAIKDEFKIIPNYFSGFKQQKKNLVTLKSKANKFKLQEMQNSIHSFRNNILYSSNIDEIDKVKEQKLILSQNQCKLDYVTIINANQYLYFIGQVFQNPENSQKIISDQFNKYDKMKNKLLKLQDLPCKSYGGQAIKYQKTIYYWGGYVQLENQQLGSKKGFMYTLMLCRYSIENDKWEQIESMKYPRIQGQCCLLDHKIYLIGGMMNQYVANGLIEIYDSILMKFVETIELINQLSYVPQLLGYALPISNQEILVIGGQNQFGNECGSQLINIFLKTVQKNSYNNIQKILNVNCTQPIIFKQQIYLFNSEEKKVEFIQINADTLQVKSIIQIQ